MLLTVHDAIAHIRDQGIEVSEQEITAFVGQSWVLPVEREGRLLFDEADAARIRLIVELRRDMEVNDEAVPVVLNLLDQVYGLHQALEEIRLAVQKLPLELRHELEASLAKVIKE
jgi:chaperone modulatory protein CbpM